MKDRENDHSLYENWIDPENVIPYEKNVKIHTEKQVSNIVNSIRRFGWQQDTVITNDNVCVIGHGRRLAAIKLGCQMPYHRVNKNADELTEEDIRELRIADNQTNSETGYDFSLLEEELEDLDFDGFDFDFNIDVTPSDETVEGGEVDDNTEEPCAVKIIFKNVKEWRKAEDRIREVVDQLDDVHVSVGEYDENK